MKGDLKRNRDFKSHSQIKVSEIDLKVEGKENTEIKQLFHI